MQGGTGEPLIYLHGAAGGGNWLPCLDLLSKHFQVYAPEHPGYGKSENCTKIQSMTDLAYFYLDLMDDLSIDSATFVGSSLGGWLALEIAIIAPHRVSKLILLDSAGIRVEGVEVVDQFIMDPNDVLELLFYDKSIPEKLRSLGSSDPEAVEMNIRNRIMTSHLAWNPYFHNPKIRERIHRVKIPVLIVWGEKDEIFPVEYGHEFLNLLPNAKLTVIKDCGHLPAQEKVNEFYNEAISFLQGGE
nr:alpha/beta fold hydrolase [Ammoniphilus resinae]